MSEAVTDAEIRDKFDRGVDRLFQAMMLSLRKDFELAELPPDRKIVVRLEVRCSGAYLDAEVGELGDQGSVILRAVRSTEAPIVKSTGSCPGCGAPWDGIGEHYCPLSKKG